MPKASVSRPTAHPEAETNLVCPFLTALQILLQPLPQPRCLNERSRISSSSHRSIPHCPTGKIPETKRTRVPLVRGRACTRLAAGRGLGEDCSEGEGARTEGGRAHAWRWGGGGLEEGCWGNLK